MNQDPRDDSDLTYQIIGLAMRVHRSLGPGLLESVYETCLCHELTQAGISFRRQISLPLQYDGVDLDCGYIADIIVDDQVILELKAVDLIQKLHEAQLLNLYASQPLPHRPADQLQHGVPDRWSSNAACYDGQGQATNPLNRHPVTPPVPRAAFPTSAIALRPSPVPLA